MLQTKPFTPEELGNIETSFDRVATVEHPDLENFSEAQKAVVTLKPTDQAYRLHLARAKRLIADECLIQTSENLLVIYSHAGFETYWNCMSPEIRDKIKIIRPYWFGRCGARLDYRQAGARTQEEIEEFISRKLIDSLKRDIALYKEKAVVCNFYRDKQVGKVPKDETNFRQAFVSDYNGVGLEYSTYKYALFRGLAGEAPLPEIPEDSLTKAEYDELKKEFLSVKTKENK